MSNALADRAGAAPGFGHGGSEPFDHAIRAGGGLISITTADRRAEVAATLDVSAFLAPATAEERQAIALTMGPLLDVGCGPGRIVRAAIDAGRLTLGIDISSAAVVHANAEGLPVLRRSVFDPLPTEGAWGALTLFDGNVGIEGDPEALLARCAGLIRRGGRMVVETHQEHERDRRFEARLVHPSGGSSGWFSWAEAGAATVLSIVRRLGMQATTVTIGDRSFVVATR